MAQIKTVDSAGRPRMMHVHKQVRALAIEMAGKLFDEVMRNNELYEHWQQLCPELKGLRGAAVLEATFITLAWPKLVSAARATLAQMLGDPTHKNLHEEIYDALIRDNALRRGRRRPDALRANLQAEMQANNENAANAAAAEKGKLQ